MKLLPLIIMHYPAKGKWEYPNLGSCYLHLLPNLPSMFALDLACLQHFAALTVLSTLLPMLRHYSHFTSFWYRLCGQQHLPATVFSCQGHKCSYQKFADLRWVVVLCRGYVSNSPGGGEPAHLRFVWHASWSFIQNDNIFGTCACCDSSLKVIT